VDYGFVFASRRSGDGADDTLSVERYGALVLEQDGMGWLHGNGERQPDR
jgi:hypothetical protein